MTAYRESGPGDDSSISDYALDLMTAALTRALAADAGVTHPSYTDRGSDMWRQAERLVSAIRPELHQVQASTIHGLSHEMESLDGSRLNLPPQADGTRPSVYTAQDVRDWLRTWAVHHQVLAEEARSTT